MEKAFESWVEKNLGSQQGKTVIVTGANTGIGFYTALGLAKMGANVTVAGRSEEKVNNAVEAIRKENITGSVEGGIIDLASLDSIRKFAKQFNSSHDKLEILINNAGVMMPPESKTAEGFELQFGVNYLGHFLLTQLLYDKLKSTKDARVVTLSSIAHRSGEIDFDNFRVEKSYDPRREYYQSKLADLMFTLELGRRIQANGDNILSVACHPGFTKTDLQRHLDPAVFANLTLMDTWQGSLPTLLAATSKDAKSGDYYGPDGEGEFSGFPALGKIEERALNQEISKRLWEEGMKATGLNS